MATAMEVTAATRQQRRQWMAPWRCDGDNGDDKDVDNIAKCVLCSTTKRNNVLCNTTILFYLSTRLGRCARPTQTPAGNSSP